MRIGCPVETFLLAVKQALERDLPVHDFSNPADPIGDLGLLSGVRRPSLSEIVVYHFLQEWEGDRDAHSLYTTVVICEPMDVACVYFSARHVYTVRGLGHAFYHDVGRMAMKPVNRFRDYDMRETT